MATRDVFSAEELTRRHCQTVGAELLIQGGDLRYPLTVAVGHDRRA
jgi:hypothetical protein